MGYFYFRSIKSNAAITHLFEFSSNTQEWNWKTIGSPTSTFPNAKLFPEVVPICNPTHHFWKFPKFCRVLETIDIILSLIIQNQ